MFVFINTLYAVFVFSYLIIKRKHWILNPTYLFVVIQSVYYFGTIKYVNFQNSIDRTYVLIMLIGIIMFLIGSIITDLIHREQFIHIGQWWDKPIENENNRRGLFFIINALLVFSILISFLYFYSIGYNVFILVLKAKLLAGSGTELDIATLRLSTYSGESYFAPGYVNQFKNLFLPILSVYLLVDTIIKKNANLFKFFICSVLIFISFISLVGTGQRWPLIIIGIVSYYFINAVFSIDKKKRKKFNFIIVLIMFASFIILTVFLGRGVSTIKSLKDVFDVLYQIYHRIFESGQSSGIIGFRYIYDHPTVYGAEWIESFKGILPGHRGSTLSSEIFATIYGGGRGTSPVTIWGSFWYNFGLIGIVFIPLILGAIYELIYLKLFSGKKNLIRLLIYSTVVVILGTWDAGTPVALINRGLISIIILNKIVRIIQGNETNIAKFSKW